MNRFSAFFTHLGISLLILLLIGYLVMFYWYPDFFFTTDGGWQGIQLVALVGLVLGPVLTLCVYKKGKPGLRMDLTLISIFQFCCLAAGTYVVHAERPLAVVYSDGYFHSMTAEDYKAAGQPVPILEHLPGPSPKWVTTALPEDLAAQYAIRSRAMQERTPLSTLSEFYKPYAGADIDLARDPYPIEALKNERPAELADFIAEHGGAAEEYLFFPLGARYQLALLALRRSDLSVVDAMPLRAPPSETTSHGESAAG